MERFYLKRAFVNLPFTFFLLPCTLVPVSASVNILLSTTTISQGQSLRIEADGVTPNEQARLSFQKGFYPFFTIGPDAQRALLGIRLDAAPGTYSFRIQHYAKRSGKWETIAESSIEISSHAFPVETVNFTPEKTALFKYEHQESAKIHKLLTTASPDQYWEGMFDFPVQGPIIGDFGVHRIRNGNIDAGFHKGYDIKAKSGTPVLASAGGVVLLAQTLKAHGRTVLINHGQGVMTIYLHLKSFTVKPGQKVVRGEKIGVVGSSGLSTAPHVHWGLYIHGVPVDPKPWTETEF